MEVTVHEVPLGAQQPEVFAIVALSPTHLEVWVNSDSQTVREGTT